MGGVDVPVIGQKVWLFDENHRVYAAGNRMGGPIFREHFIEHTIIGETSQSWLLDGRQYKINKATGKLRKPDSNGYFGLSPIVYYSPEEVENRVFKADNLYQMERDLRDASGAQLRRIAAILAEDK